MTTAAKTLEYGFEDAICRQLAERGWLYEPDAGSTGFDPHLALHTADALWWLRARHPDEYVKAVPEHLPASERRLAEDSLIQGLVRSLNRKPTADRTKGGSRGGLMGTLRNGFSHKSMNVGTSATFDGMVSFPPANPVVDTVAKLAELNRLRVIRQVRFDTKSNETIDIVLLVNGVPVVTMELKTDNTQTIDDAETQYKIDREPSGTRPLLQPGRCLVHFAVSNSEVRMTTRLDGKNTRFLPFNQGNDGHAGNPPCADGSETSYLWRDVLEREQFLRILQSFAVWKPSSGRGKKAGPGTLIFPRYHQMRAVEAVTADIADKGAGGRYLIQHSAGSGKTMTISWLAHRLVRHYTGTAKTFDSVIVISDRTVLDRNLREDIAMLPASAGLFVPVGTTGGAKSPVLAKALAEGGHIITCTLQTFPEVIRRIGGDGELAARKWCVIADEAHSSQTGSSAAALRRLLAMSVPTGEDDESIDADDLLAATDAAVATAANITFVAFTATPKAKTVRLFGTKVDGEDRWVPFDEYTMAQAIEEGFILDVLTNYSTYDMFIRVRDAMGREDLVDKGDVVGEIVRYAKAHETSIAQKVAVVVEHFRANVAHLLGGQARAMVVTSSRQDAYRWAVEMSKYIEHKGWADEFQTLVAFSGSLSIPGVGEVTEVSMNGLSDVETAFKDSDADYRVLIVASKFQTGFDEPRLCAMYVDKVLSGVAAVQTLSRLNRVYHGTTEKPAPMVVDFVNNPAGILDSFKTYYKTAKLAGEVDPNALFDLADSLDGAGFYDEDDLDAVAAAYTADDDAIDHEAFRALISPIVDEWSSQMRQARIDGDADAVGALLDFRAELRTYVKTWEFLSQIVNFGDTTLHKRAILATYLMRNLHVEGKSIVDIGGVDVIGVATTPAEVQVNLGLADGQGELDVPTFTGASAGEGTATTAAFNEAVDEANDILTRAGIHVSDAATRGFVYRVWGSIAPNASVGALAAENTPEQIAAAPGFTEAIEEAIVTVMQEDSSIQEFFLLNHGSMGALKTVLAQLAFAAAREIE